jgi:hypothetical protein
VKRQGRALGLCVCVGACVRARADVKRREVAEGEVCSKTHLCLTKTSTICALNRIPGPLCGIVAKPCQKRNM